VATAAAGRVARDGTEIFGHPGGPDPRSRRAPERAHRGMRKRGAQEATTEQGRLGVEDPVTGTSRAARRYAKAVFQLAEQDRQLGEWERRLTAVRELLSDPEVAAVLTNPTIPNDQRMALISAPPHLLDPEATNLAKLLIESNRVRDVAAIAEEFQRLADEAAGRVRATVTRMSCRSASARRSGCMSWWTLGSSAV